ncbi:MAG: fimbrillin family protein [Bacteroidaceae bacterium]|nr:fimbrillin family protein [Bacteroidaceae bacterium]
MKTKYLLFAASLAWLASCSNDEDFTPQNTPITVSVGVAELSTRAGYESTSVLPETFYLTVTQDTEDATSQYNYTDVNMTKGTDNAYTSTSQMLWKDATRTPFVSAYTIEGTTFSVQTNQRTTESVLAGDLLGAVSTTEGDIAISSDNIGISFRHLLCKLDVTYTWGTELDGATTKTIKNVKYQDFGTDVTLDRTTCTVAVPAEPTTANIQALVTGLTSEAIFAPHIGTAPKIVITATVDGVDRIFSIDVKAPADGFASGTRYTMDVTIGGTAVTTPAMQIGSGWGDSIQGDNMTTD